MLDLIIQIGAGLVAILFVTFMLVALWNSRGYRPYRQQSESYLTSHLNEIKRQNELLERIARALEKT